jgi:hypothetical protein
LLKHNKRANGKVDAVVMSDGRAADRIARLILNIKRSNQNTKILVIAGEDSDKNKDIDYGADEFALKPMSSVKRSRQGL